MSTTVHSIAVGILLTLFALWLEFQLQQHLAQGPQVPVLLLVQMLETRTRIHQMQPVLVLQQQHRLTMIVQLLSHRPRPAHPMAS